MRKMSKKNSSGKVGQKRMMQGDRFVGYKERKKDCTQHRSVKCMDVPATREGRARFVGRCDLL